MKTVTYIHSTIASCPEDKLDLDPDMQLTVQQSVDTDKDIEHIQTMLDAEIIDSVQTTYQVDHKNKGNTLSDNDVPAPPSAMDGDRNCAKISQQILRELHRIGHC